MGDVNHEPTMEEILASIKKIIAEDGKGPASLASARKARTKKQALDSGGDGEDVLELTDPLAGEDRAEEATEDRAEKAPPVPLHDADDADEGEALASDKTVDVGREAFAALVAASERHEAAGGQPLESMVREMLKPLLKQWIDENLPSMVEELVAREIARIAAGRD